MKRNSKGLKITRVFLFGLPLLCILTLAASALSNLGLPTESTNASLLSEEQKSLLSEAKRLRADFGNQVWPGWETSTSPVIVHNEEYAFLVDYPGQPPDGWRRTRDDKQQGGAWEVVPGDDFEGTAYYRQPLSPVGPTPENFTVLVGDTWAATLYTREYTRIALRADFDRQTPFPLNKIIPYRLLWQLLLGNSETYIGALIHETFHAYQATVVPDRLDAAENSIVADTDYPWEDRDLAASWQAEMDLLAGAVRAEDFDEAHSLACQFVTHRDDRRAAFSLTEGMVTMEREREWLEGQAKYVELITLRLTGEMGGGDLSSGISADPDFSDYAVVEDYYWQQVDEVQRLSNRSGDIRFYYTGFAQGALLDRLNPGWQARAFDPGVYLEDLLREVCEPSASR